MNWRMVAVAIGESWLFGDGRKAVLDPDVFTTTFSGMLFMFMKGAVKSSGVLTLMFVVRSRAEWASRV